MPALPAAVAAAVLFAGCSGTDTAAAEDEVATLQATVTGDGAADAAIRTDEAPDLEPDEAALQFSQCMRDEGLEFPDLSVDAEGNINLRDAFQDVAPGAEGFREAMEACREILQQTGFGGGRGQFRDSPEFQDGLVSFSACVRDAGFDVGDITLGGAPGPGQNQAQQGQGGEAEQGGDAGEGGGQRGQRAEGFGNRGVRLAENLGLDYDDPEVAEAVDGCLPLLDQALSDLGVTPPGGNTGQG
jgi:hypothetical protein